MQSTHSMMLQVAGMLGDVHFSRDHEQIELLVIQIIPALFKFVNVSITSTEVIATLSMQESKLKTIESVASFPIPVFEGQLGTSHGFFDIVSICGWMAFIAITMAFPVMLGMAHIQ